MVLVPFSPLVLNASVGLLRFSRNLWSLATVDILVSSILQILVRSIPKKDSWSLKNLVTAALLKAVAQFIIVPSGCVRNISKCLFLKAVNHFFRPLVPVG